MTLAIALSIAVHEIIAGLIPRTPERTPATRESVTHVHIARVAIHSLWAPTPRPRSAHVAEPVPVTAAKRVQRVAPKAAPLRPVPAKQSSARPVWDAAGNGAGAGALAAQNGAGGNGSEAQGNGNGAERDGQRDAQPCGFVTFSDPHGSQYDARTHGFWVDIRMSVHFADGSAQSLILDYPWYYPSEAANPWSEQNLKDSNFPMRFQPPPGRKIAQEPVLVRYVADHSTPEGMTLLSDCPTGAPTTYMPKAPLSPLPPRGVPDEPRSPANL